MEDNELESEIEIIPTDMVEMDEMDEIETDESTGNAVGAALLGVGATIGGIALWKGGKKLRSKARDRYERFILDRATKVEIAIRARDDESDTETKEVK